MEHPNLSYIDELSGGDQAFKQKLIDIIKKELPVEISEYESNMKACHFEIAAENVHKLKHKISILGLVDAYDLAIDYEEDVKSGCLDKQSEFELILSKMSQFIEEL